MSGLLSTAASSLKSSADSCRQAPLLNIPPIIQSTGVYAATNDILKAVAQQKDELLSHFLLPLNIRSWREKYNSRERERNTFPSLSIIGFELHFRAVERWQTQSTHKRIWIWNESLKSFFASSICGITASSSMFVLNNQTGECRRFRSSRMR